MPVSTHGRIDFEDGRFVARFDGEPTVVAMLKTIQRCHWRASHAAWVIEAHWPSVRHLIRIALQQRWEVSAESWKEKERVQTAGEELEYSLDMIHDNHGHARFRCRVGDDDELRDEIEAIPGTYWEDEYWSVPTDWEHCCPPLREIVAGDARFTVSPAAELLLHEQDVSHLHVRTIAPPSEVAAKRRAKSEEANEVVVQELSDAVVEAKPMTRKPRVTTGAKKHPPAVNEDVSGRQDALRFSSSRAPNEANIATGLRSAAEARRRSRAR